jgi:pyrroline-5-carboxylate reductase
MNARIALIGAGNMAQALIGGLLARGHASDRLVAADPDGQIRDAVAHAHGIATTADNAEAAAGADIVVLAVKPQLIEEVARSVVGALRRDALIVSVAAGTTMARLNDSLGADRAIVRVMPNTPALHGVGATGLFAGERCSSAQRKAALELFRAVGRVFEIADESLMDVVTAVSGSGPAYFFRLAEALANAGVDAGLDRETAEELASQTAAGAGAMLAAGEASAAELRSRVTSPGGTTAAALAALDDNGMDELVRAAVEAAVARGREMGQSSSSAP